MAEIDYKIEKHIGIIGESTKGWMKEVNLISWNGRPAKYDIREWAPDKSKMGKGITLTKEELKSLYYVLAPIFSKSRIDPEGLFAEVHCIQNFIEDDEALWSEGCYYDAVQVEKDGWRIKTNQGAWGWIGLDYTNNEFKDYFEIIEKEE